MMNSRLARISLHGEELTPFGECLLPMIGRMEAKRQPEQEQTNPSSPGGECRDGGPSFVVGGESRIDEHRVDALDVVQGGVRKCLVQIRAMGIPSVRFERGPTSATSPSARRGCASLPTATSPRGLVGFGGLRRARSHACGAGGKPRADAPRVLPKATRELRGQNLGREACLRARARWRTRCRRARSSGSAVRRAVRRRLAGLPERARARRQSACRGATAGRCRGAEAWMRVSTRRISSLV